MASAVPSAIRPCSTSRISRCSTSRHTRVVASGRNAGSTREAAAAIVRQHVDEQALPPPAARRRSAEAVRARLRLAAGGLHTHMELDRGAALRVLNRRDDARFVVRQ